MTLVNNHPLRRLFSSPEGNIAIFAFLLNFFWEVQQMPFFDLPLSLSCQERVINCTLATIGDVGISLVAFWIVAAVAHSRRWVLNPRGKQIGLAIFVGLVITVIFEALATGVLNRWEYTSTMPTVPWLGTGVMPVLQWILIPPMVIGLVKRQLT